MSKRVLVQEDVINGNPNLEGTRLSVFDIVMDCKQQGVQCFLDKHLQITFEDVRAVFEYCSNRQCDVDKSHCGGCSLRLEQDGVNCVDEFIDRFAEVHFEESDEILRGNGSGIMIMPKTSSELWQTWHGEDGWLIAKQLCDELDK